MVEVGRARREPGRDSGRWPYTDDRLFEIWTDWVERCAVVLGGGKREGVPIKLDRLEMDEEVGWGIDGFTGLGRADEGLTGEVSCDVCSWPTRGGAAGIGLSVGSLEKRGMADEAVFTGLVGLEGREWSMVGTMA